MSDYKASEASLIIYSSVVESDHGTANLKVKRKMYFSSEAMRNCR